MNRKIVCIVCGQDADFKMMLSDVKQDMMVVGTYCQDHALEQCDNQKNVIMRFAVACKIGL